MPVDTLPTKLNQKALRQWMRRKGGHRRFTVLRHPVARAHAAFCDKILIKGPGCYRDIRRTLRNFHKLPIPQGDLDAGYDRDAHRLAFAAFLRFLKANLAGQTSIRVDAHWATQAAVLEGLADFAPPDMVVRESEMAGYLTALARQVGYSKAPSPANARDTAPFPLAEIYDAEIEALTRDAYLRDYMTFGFGDWA